MTKLTEGPVWFEDDSKACGNRTFIGLRVSVWLTWWCVVRMDHKAAQFFFMFDALCLTYSYDETHAVEEQAKAASGQGGCSLCDA